MVTHAMLPNGPGHRLVQVLLRAGHEVAFCALPLPGASRWRAERMLPGEARPKILVDKPRPVTATRELRSLPDFARFAWRLDRLGHREVVLVGCDAVSYLEAAGAFCTAPIRVTASAVWFVDWSAQRLHHPLSAAAYRLAARSALRVADVAAAISPEAADAVARLRPRPGQVLVLPNQPLDLGVGLPWGERPLSVAYVGGLSDQQGVSVLLEAAALLSREGVAVDIVGDGAARAEVSAAVANLSGVHYHGLVEDVATLAQVMLAARVGWALYDPKYAMHRYNDPLKVKDYLAAGMRVVSTLPRSTQDAVVTMVPLSAAALVEATRQALTRPPGPEPSAHPLLLEGSRALDAFVSAIDKVR